MADVEVSTEIDAPAERVWTLVSDLPRMGEWSPECTRCDWLGGATKATPGSRFKGRNRLGWHRWSTDGVVVEAEPPHRLVFDISYLRMPVARWSYDIEDLGGGRTRVTEGWSDTRGRFMTLLGGVGTGVTDRKEHNVANMEATLARVKAEAEAATAS